MTTAELTKDLNDLLKGEISACETYKQAMEQVKASQLREVLQTNLQCHSSRVEQLKTEISEKGGHPVEGSGAWGAFTKMLEGGAAAFGDKSIISVLEEGEDKGMAEYKKLTEKYGTQTSIISELKLKHEGSHARCRDLKHAMA